GALEAATAQQGHLLGEKQPCPQCGKLCTVGSQERPCVPKEGSFPFASRSVTARLVVGIFFPQRPVLKLDGHGYSPTTMYHILYATAEVKSHQKAAKLLDVLDDLAISGRHVNRLAEEIGLEMAVQRDRAVEDFVHHRKACPALAGIFLPFSALAVP